MTDTPGDISLWIERHAGFSPGRTAVRFQGRTISYADLAYGIERAAAMGFKAVGLKPDGFACRVAARLARSAVSLASRRLAAAGV